MIRKQANGSWLVDIRQDGRGSKRIRKQFETKSEANRFLHNMAAQRHDDAVWAKQSDKRRLSDLVKLWFVHHGHSLSDGQARKNKLLSICSDMNDPAAARFRASEFATYRLERMSSGISANTLNHEHAYLKAVFNELKRQRLWPGENPMNSIRRLKVNETELSFLSTDQIDQLLRECRASSNRSIYFVASLALATGARWSEAETVSASSFTPHRVTYTATKSGKSRSVPLHPTLYRQLKKAAPFSSCYGAFRSALARTEIELPKGQLSHICRHTFASHFCMNGGHILTLQKVLGHSDLKLTMRYAHLAPDFLNEVIDKGPWAKCGHFQEAVS